MSKHRPAQLVQTSKRQFHLRFDAGDLADSKTSGLPARISQKRGLARSRLSPDDQHPAPATADVLEQAVQLLTLAGTAPEPRRALDAHRPQSLDDQGTDQWLTRARGKGAESTLHGITTTKQEVAMSATEAHDTSSDTSVGKVDMKLENQIIPVSDVDR